MHNGLYSGFLEHNGGGNGEWFDYANVPDMSPLPIEDLAQIQDWSQLCGPHSHPQRDYYSLEAGEGRCMEVAGSDDVVSGMNVQVDQCSADRSARQRFCFFDDLTIR